LRRLEPRTGATGLVFVLSPSEILDIVEDELMVAAEQSCKLAFFLKVRPAQSSLCWPVHDGRTVQPDD
jgi:hypothetical protein